MIYLEDINEFKSIAIEISITNHPLMFFRQQLGIYYMNKVKNIRNDKLPVA